MISTTLYVGIDMSLSSPGIAIKWSGDTKWSLIGFQQRKTDRVISGEPIGEKLLISRLTYPPFTDRWDKIEYLTNVIVELINMNLKEILRKDPHVTLKIGIEGYAFRAPNSSSITPLAELGGCLRLALRQKFSVQPQEITPSTAKKHFAGNGHASKEQVIQAYHEVHGFPLLNSILNVKSHQHPQEDMIDAMAVCYTLMNFTSPSSITHEKSQKKSLVKKRKKPAS